MKILYVDAIKCKHAQNNVTGLLSAFQCYGKTDTFDQRTLAKVSSVEKMNKALVKTCIQNNYDVIFLGKCESVLGESIKTIKDQTNSFVISFLGDFYWEPCPFKYDQNQYADLSLFSYFDERIISKYKMKNSGFWTDGCNSGLDINLHTERTHDVVFLGNNHSVLNNYLENYTFRYELLKHIDNNFNLTVYGNGWDDFKNTHAWVTNKDKTIAVNKAKITIGVSAVEAFLYLSWPRVFQTMACGALHMTQYVDGLELIFKNHENIVWFKTINEANELIKYYLKNDQLLSRIALNGMNLSQQHTYYHRVGSIIDCKIKSGLLGYIC